MRPQGKRGNGHSELLRRRTHVFLFQQQQLFSRLVDVLLQATDGDRVSAVVARKPDVNLVRLHELPDGAALGADEAAVNPGVDLHIYTDLILLKIDQRVSERSCSTLPTRIIA